MYTYNARKYDCRNLGIVWWQKSTKVMCEEILQWYSSQYSSESLAIKILLSTTGLISRNHSTFEKMFFYKLI
jgi:hypothetical protein